MKVQELAEIVRLGFNEIGKRFEQVDARFERSDVRADHLENELHRTRILVEGLYPRIEDLGEMIQGVSE